MSENISRTTLVFPTKFIVKTNFNIFYDITYIFCIKIILIVIFIKVPVTFMRLLISKLISGTAIISQKYKVYFHMSTIIYKDNVTHIIFAFSLMFRFFFVNSRRQFYCYDMKVPARKSIFVFINKNLILT